MRLIDVLTDRQSRRSVRASRGDRRRGRRNRRQLMTALLATFVALGLTSSTGAVGGSGALYSWGQNYYFQLGDGIEKYTIDPTPPSGLPGVVSSVAVYDGGTFALSGGTWYGWGYGPNGDLCDGSTNSAVTPVATNFPASAVLEGGGYHTLALSGGGVQGCGDNGVGQLGDGTTTIRTSPVPVSGLSSGVVAIGVGENHSLAVMSDGTVRSWGYNYSGQLGDGTTANRSTPVTVSGLSNVTAVTGGYMHSLALTSSGSVLAWGWNAHGEVGDGTKDQRKTPVPVLGLTGVVAIAAGNFYSMALKGDGTVWTWGGDYSGQLGTGSGTDATTPQQVPGLTGVTAIDAGPNHAVALKSDGTVVTWGANYYRQLGNATSASPGLPSTVSGLTDVVAIGAGRDHSSALRSDGTLVSWGGNVSGSASATHVDVKTTPGAVAAPGDSGIVGVSAGYDHALGLTSAGEVLAWGGNSYGQLGDGGTSTSATPLPVAGLGAGVRQVATSSYYASYALRADGSVAAWGSNNNAELGDGTTTSRPTPVSVTGLPGPVSSIAVGGFHGLALMGDKTVRSWGSNYSGELGDGTTNQRTSAVPVTGLVNIVAVGAGGSSSYAVTATGGLYAWGNNAYGQLGDGTTTNNPVPTLVQGLTNVLAVAAGDNYAIALRNDGSVWAWGSNWDGVLGDGTTNQRATPAPVSGLSGGVVAIAARGLHSLALKSDGTVSAWGYNGVGQVGNGDTNDVLVPTPVVGLSGPVQAIATGWYSSFAVVGVGDSDGDGVADDIDDDAAGVGAFRDPITGQGDAFGQIVSVAAGLTVSVTDAPDPDGVQISVSPPGTGRVKLRLCGATVPPGFYVYVYAGATALFDCGSVIATTVTGQVEIELAPDTILTVPADVTTEVAATTGGGYEIVSVEGGSVTMTVNGVTTPPLEAGTTVIRGTSGNNRIIGTPDADVIFGNGGNDTISGKGGNDVIVTLGGNDTIDGGAGDDTINAGNGNNDVKGGDGDDTITTGSGNDTIDGGPHRTKDVCTPGGGKNSVKNCEG